jgi:glutamate dehydrogenase/leucine dehydrogenase
MDAFWVASISILLPTALCVVLHEHHVPHLALAAIWATVVLFLLGGAGAVAFASQESSDEQIEAIIHAYGSHFSSLAGLVIGLIGGIWLGTRINEH